MPLKQHGFKQRQHETQLLQEFQHNRRQSLAMKLSQVTELQCNECHYTPRSCSIVGKSPGVEALGNSLSKFGRTTVELERISLAVSKFRGSHQTASCPIYRLRKIACTAIAEPPNVNCRTSSFMSSESWSASFFRIEVDIWSEGFRESPNCSDSHEMHCKALSRHYGTCRV